MATNTDIVVGLIVDGVINSMKSQLDNKVPDAVFDAVRTGAVLAASSAIPAPVRLAINAVPASAIKTAGNVVAKKAANAGAVGNLIKRKKTD